MPQHLRGHCPKPEAHTVTLSAHPQISEICGLSLRQPCPQSQLSGKCQPRSSNPRPGLLIPPGPPSRDDALVETSSASPAITYLATGDSCPLSVTSIGRVRSGTDGCSDGDPGANGTCVPFR